MLNSLKNEQLKIIVSNITCLIAVFCFLLFVLAIISEVLIFINNIKSVFGGFIVMVKKFSFLVCLLIWPLLILITLKDIRERVWVDDNMRYMWIKAIKSNVLSAIVAYNQIVINKVKSNVSSLETIKKEHCLSHYILLSLIVQFVLVFIVTSKFLLVILFNVFVVSIAIHIIVSLLVYYEFLKYYFVNLSTGQNFVEFSKFINPFGKINGGKT